jgi:hypothetical protein
MILLLLILFLLFGGGYWGRDRWGMGRALGWGRFS